MNSVDQIADKVLSYDKLALRIADRPGDRERAILYLKEMATDYQVGMIEKLRSLLGMTLVKLYDDIDFTLPPGLDLHQTIQDYSVVFVPNHQSHADYLMLSYALYDRFQFIPLIAGGINLNIFPIGDLFRKSGCFFIRRSFNSNIIYKLTLEAYIAYLFSEGHCLEFFYEGGRSRSGRLLPPKYGMFQMILETHHQMDASTKKPLLFIPVSIVHEIVPEQRTLTRELEGNSKKPESFAQLLGLYKYLFKRLGTVHIKIAKPINYDQLLVERKHFAELNVRARTQKMAHKCYREVGKGMVITPSALLILILLNEPSGPLTLSSIVERARPIINYCEKFNIPLAGSLRFGDLEKSLQGLIRIFLESGKLKEINNQKLLQTFYTVAEDARIELLYSKNAILHHFLVPFFIHCMWVNVFNGTIKNADGLRDFLQERLEQLKDEFILPTLNELFYASIDIVADCIGRRLRTLEDCFEMSPAEMYSIALRVAPFANAFRHIFEGHYIAAITLRYFKNNSFDSEQFLKVSKEHFELERTHGRFIRYSESYTVPTIKNVLGYFLSIDLVRPVGPMPNDLQEEEERKDRISNLYYVPNQRQVDEQVTRYAKELTEALILNLRGPDSIF